MIAEQICIVDESRGIYIPQHFAQNFSMRDFNISEVDEQALLTGPTHPDYWEVWDKVLMEAYIEIDNQKWTLAQDDALFAVRM